MSAVAVGVAGVVESSPPHTKTLPSGGSGAVAHCRASDSPPAEDQSARAGGATATKPRAMTGSRRTATRPDAETVRPAARNIMRYPPFSVEGLWCVMRQPVKLGDGAML